MDEINNLHEEQNNDKLKEHCASTPETAKASEPIANIPAPKLPIPKLPLIIGGAIAGVAAIAITVAVILGGGHNHNYGAWTIVDEPTCTVDGVEERVCECNEKETRPVAAFGHTEVVDGAVAPTCTSTGLTEGKHCSECNVVITRQNTIPMVAHTYDSKYDEECNVCGDKREAECAHAETEVILGKPASCTETGLTDGIKCKKCGETILAQNVIPLLKHSYYQTYSSDNFYHWFECSICKDVKDKGEHVINGTLTCSLCQIKVAPTEGIIYDISVDGTYAEVIGYDGTATKIRIADTYQGLPVKNIYDKAFYENYRITSVVIPNSVTSIGGQAFNGCSNLTSVVIGDGVTTIRWAAFNGCSSLTSIVIPDSVASVGEGAFSSCDSLTSVVIGDNVTSINRAAFSYCTSLTSIVIPDSVTSIGMEAFRGCYDLRSIIIPDSITSIGKGAFEGCSKLQFNEYENCTYLGNKDNPYFALIEVTIQNLSRYTIHEDTKIIAAHAFYDCSRLTSIVIPDSVTSISDYAFWYCYSLTSVVIGDSVTIIGDGAFYQCSRLASVVIGDSVTSIGGLAFGYCSTLNDVCYTGSEEAWEGIAIDGYFNEYLTNATIHYNYVPEN